MELSRDSEANIEPGAEKVSMLLILLHNQFQVMDLRTDGLLRLDRWVANLILSCLPYVLAP